MDAEPLDVPHLIEATRARASTDPSPPGDLNRRRGHHRTGRRRAAGALRGHRPVGRILLDGDRAAGVLDKLGVTHEAIRHSSARLFEPAVLTGDGGADAALAIAHRMAAHLLFVLATDEGAASRRVLDDLGVDITAIKKEINQVIPPLPAHSRRRRRKGKCDPRDRACSFCGSTGPARAMVSGPGVWICADCVTLATGHPGPR